jgi:hypothetical protein
MRVVRLLTAAIAVAVCASGCAVGVRGPVTQLTTHSAVLNGRVASTASGDASYYFEWGEGDELQKTPVETLFVGAGFAPPVSAPVDGLEPEPTYHFRVCAEDAENQGAPECSPFREFSVAATAGQDYAVGEWVLSGTLFVLDAHSGPLGENPLGSLVADAGRGARETGEVACLRVDGNRATVGVRFPTIGDSFFFLQDNPTGQDGFAGEPADGRPVTGCPAPPATFGTLQNGDVEIHDAPGAPPT